MLNPHFYCVSSKLTRVNNRGHRPRLLGRVRVSKMVLRILALLITALLVHPVSGPAQTSSGEFSYLFPRFTSAAGSELTIANLNNIVVDVEVEFFTESGDRTRKFVTLLPATESRLAPIDLGAKATGSIIVSSSVQIQVTATLAGTSEPLQMVSPADPGTDIIVPFAHGTGGTTLLDLFNHGRTDARLFVSSFGEDGIGFGTREILLPPKGNIHADLSTLVPLETSGAVPDIAYVSVRSPRSIFAAPKEVVASATIKDYRNVGSGVTSRADRGVSPGVSETSRTSTTTLPLFVQGGGFFSLLQVINTSSSSQSITLTARSQDGTIVSGTNNPASITLGPGAATRSSAAEIFGFAFAAFSMGSVAVVGTLPLVATTALGNSSANSLVMIPSETASRANFAFKTDEVNRQVFNGLTFINPGSTQAVVTLTFIRPDGTTITKAPLLIDASMQTTRTLAEILPEVQESGVVAVQSDVPLVAAAILGQVDGSSITNLPLSTFSSGFVPSVQTEFLAVGTVRSSGAALAGTAVHLSGSVSDVIVTDSAGTFTFRKIPEGAYTITPSAVGFTFTPSSIAITIADSNSRNNDFEGTLIVPKITTVTPSGIIVDSPDTDIAITGGPFIPTSEVLFEGTPLPTTVIDAQTLGTRFEATRLSLARVADLLVRNHGPAGNTVSSDPVLFAIGGPAPTILTVTGIPQEVVVGGSGFDVTLTGSGFIDGASLQINGKSRATTFIDETSIVGTVLPEDLSLAGSVTMSAINPSPTVGPSNEQLFTVLNNFAGLLSVSPTLIVARPDQNAQPVPMTLVGFNFVDGAVMFLDATELPTQFQNSTTLFAEIPASLLKDGGAREITVTNPAPVVPRVPVSETLPIMVLNPVPILESVTIAPVFFDDNVPNTLGGDPQSFESIFIFNGANWNGSTTFFFSSPSDCVLEEGGGVQVLDSRQGRATFPIECNGTWTFRVQNDQPGGGVSGFVSVTVGGFNPVQPPPQIASISPRDVDAGDGDFTLTLNGLNFASGTVVHFGTSALTPSSITSTKLEVTVPVLLVSSSGIVPVTVTTPNGGASNRVFFTVN